MIGFGSKWQTVACAALMACSAMSAVAGDVPPRTEGGQALVAPAEQLDLGDVYHVTPAEGTQFLLTADAPLMRITAVCNRVVGYFVAPFDLEEGQAPLLAGALRIPVASLSSGKDSYDAELHAPSALNLAEYPEITFWLTQASEVKLLSDEKGRKEYTLTANGELTVKDKTVAVSMPMRLLFVPFTWQTMRLNVGDMLILRFAFEVSTTELGLRPAGSPGGDLSADVAKFDFFLMCSTMSPERNLYPNITHALHNKQLRFLTLVRDFNDPEKGYEFGRALMREIWDDAEALNRLAWATLTEKGIETRDVPFAQKAAERANELSEQKDAAVLNTLARVCEEKHDWPGALKLARQAAENIEGAGPEIAPQISAALKRYEERAQKTPK
ncbi:MAG: YceI family protein [Planctomycetes bacterium]|nr:YceI family protein [Planctomycetota bacterium]